MYTKEASNDQHSKQNGCSREEAESKTEAARTDDGWRCVARAATLFAFGSVYSFVLNVAQASGESARFPPGDAWLSALLRATWWLPPLCGLVAAALGLLVPALDSRWAVRSPPPEPACTVRLLIVMLGVHHASTRVSLADAPGPLRVSVTATLCAALWLFFDRSPTGLSIASACYALAHAVARLLDERGLYNLEYVDAANTACWLPTVFFAAAIMLATLGRQLAFSFAPPTPSNRLSKCKVD